MFLKPPRRNGWSFSPYPYNRNTKVLHYIQLPKKVIQGMWKSSYLNIFFYQN